MFQETISRQSIACGERAELAVVVKGDAEVLVYIEHALLMAGGLDEVGGSAWRHEEALNCLLKESVVL